ncbi:YwbE family protein [Bacillus sp. AW]|uniref:YwbE family protein n=1 Tax=Bacillus sp. AW TaxID=2293329 RepID=UPI000E2F84A7|nr:YwbE family protein [Bacillus wiedmannii]RFB69316.1 YwbE family protein [Bacillus sp. AW]
MLKKLLFFVLLSLCVMSLSACKGEEEKLKVASDEQKIDEDKKVAEEEKRKQEEQQRAEEEKRKQEEQQRAEEEKRKQEEQQRVEEEKRKQEEQQRVEEEKRKQVEQQRAEEEKRKQEEQKTQQQQRTQKQEKTTQATGGKPTRSQISVGSHVVIQLDNDYSKTVSGVVKDILTHSETHTYGIKVRLQDGQIGRVQSVN